MVNCLSFLDVLDIAALNPNARIAVVGFCCDSLRDLARLPSKDLDAAIVNLYKALSDVTPAQDCVCINATRSITMYVFHIIMCRTYTLDNIDTDNIINMHNEY